MTMIHVSGQRIQQRDINAGGALLVSSELKLNISVGGPINASIGNDGVNYNQGFLQRLPEEDGVFIYGPSQICEIDKEYTYQLRGDVVSVQWWTNGPSVVSSGRTATIVFPSWSSSYIVTAGVNMKDGSYKQVNYVVNIECGDDGLEEELEVVGPQTVCDNGDSYTYELKGEYESVQWWTNGPSVVSSGRQATVIFPSWSSSYIVTVGVNMKDGSYEQINYAVNVECGGDVLDEELEVVGPQRVCDKGDSYTYELKGEYESVQWWTNGPSVASSGRTATIVFPSWSSSYIVTAGVNKKGGGYEQINYAVNIECGGDVLGEALQIVGPQQVCDNGDSYAYELNGEFERVQWWTNGPSVVGIDGNASVVFPSWSSSYIITAGVNKITGEYEQVSYVVTVDCNSSTRMGDNINTTQEPFVYPNPAKDEVYIEGDIEGVSLLTVYNVQGKEQFKETNVGRLVNISSLLPGAYYFQVKKGDEIIRQVIIKQ